MSGVPRIRGGTTRRSLIVVSLAFACLPLSAQTGTIDDWYRTNARAGIYISVRDEIAAAVVRGEAALVPGDVFTDILDEAASKGVPPERVVAALTARAGELIRLKTFLDRTRECLAGRRDGAPYDTAVLLRNCAQFLRRGIAPDVIEEVFRSACARCRSFTAALDALRTIANIPFLGEIPAEKLGTLGAVMLGSGMSPSGYTALSSVYIKGTLRNLKAVDITDIIISVLKEGKGMVRIEQELNRRVGQ